MLWSGRPDDAQDLASDPGVQPLVRSAIKAVGPDPAGGRAELELAARTNADDAVAATSLLLAVHRVHEDWAAARDVVAGEPRVQADFVLYAQTVAFRSGAKRESAEIGQAWLDRTGPVLVDQPEVPATIAYNTACGWAGAGELDRGLAAFRRAAELGFTDLTAVDSDDDIAAFAAAARLRRGPSADQAARACRGRRVPARLTRRPRAAGQSPSAGGNLALELVVAVRAAAKQRVRAPADGDLDGHELFTVVGGPPGDEASICHDAPPCSSRNCWSPLLVASTTWMPFGSPEMSSVVNRPVALETTDAPVSWLV